MGSLYTVAIPFTFSLVDGCRLLKVHVFKIYILPYFFTSCEGCNASKSAC